MKPTIRDVAKYAGVSVATVSRYLNNSPLIAPQSVERVRQAIEALNYQPSMMARGLLHGKGVAAALEMVMAQNGAAHDGKICVAAHKVVGELLNEVQQLAEGGPLDLHGGVLAVEHDAVLVVVDVGAVLEEPVLLIDGNGDDPVLSLIHI